METPRELVLLKLGGSLITDKSQPLTAREDVIQQLADEVAAYHAAHPETQIILGHGSGSFGHAVASQYQTQNGVHSPEEWQGFADLGSRPSIEPNRDPPFCGCRAACGHLCALCGITADNGEVHDWDLTPLQTAISHNLIPVVLGDVIFDRTLGGTIFSTEKVFQHLAKVLHPARILLAGIEKGVYQDPDNTDQIIPLITPSTLGEIQQQVSGSHQVDVTGGMESKVALMLDLVGDNPGQTVRIFSAEAPGNLQGVLEGANLGTLLAA